MSEALAEPWFSFLSDLDSTLTEPVELHCFGGFIVSQHYGFGRETADLDVLSVAPRESRVTIAAVAGKGSPLHRKHRVYVDPVNVANHPDSYERRLVRAFPLWMNVRLWALEPHDLALTKLERSNERDIRDVIFLAQAGLIRRQTLVERFENEMLPYLSGRTPTWHQTTLNMWVETCWPHED